MRIRRVEKDPYGGWIARDKFGVEYFDGGFRWNSRSVARAVVEEDRITGDHGVEAYKAEIHARRTAAACVRAAAYYQCGFAP